MISKSCFFTACVVFICFLIFFIYTHTVFIKAVSKADIFLNYQLVQNFTEKYLGQKPLRQELLLSNDECNIRDEVGNFISDLELQQTFPTRSTVNRQECSNYWMKNNLQDSTFKKVENYSEIYVYTGYLDKRIKKSTFVRIYTYVHPKTTLDLFCHFLDTKTGQSLLVESSKNYNSVYGIAVIKEWKSPKWLGGVVNCPIDEKTLQQIGDLCSVFLSTSNQRMTAEQLRNRRAPEIPLRSTVRNESYLKKRALCVRNLHQSETIALSLLIENIEYNFHSGVDIIVFYVSEKLSKAIAQLIFSYSKKNPLKDGDRILEIRLVPWYLPEPNKVYAFSQPLLTNDCLMRIQPEVKYIQFHDIDEFVVPAISGASIDKVVDQYLQDNSMYKAGAMCLNARLYPFNHINPYIFPDDEQDKIILRATESRLRCPEEDTIQKKCIIDPLKILEMNVHYPWKNIDGLLSLQIETDPGKYAKIHHFRHWDHFCNDIGVIDSSHKDFFSPDWKRRIKNRIHILFLLCI